MEDGVKVKTLEWKMEAAKTKTKKKCARETESNDNFSEEYVYKTVGTRTRQLTRQINFKEKY